MKNTNRFFLLALALCAMRTASAQTPSASWTELVTSKVGLDSAAAFCVYVADINNDKYPDILAVNGGYSASATSNVRAYINVQDTASSNPKDRMFVDITATSGINTTQNPADLNNTLVVALADINNDGNLDMVRGNYYHADSNAYANKQDRCEVLLGDGKGHFSIVPNNGLHELGLINNTGFCFLDYDKDGKLDLFASVWFADYTITPEPIRAGFLMHGNGDGTFTNVSAAAGITKPEPMYGCDAVDWNNDGWPDIATAPYCRTGGQLWKNMGDGTFQDVSATANYNAKYMQGDNGQNLCMWSSAPEDFDNDGDMDFMFSLTHGGNDPNEGHSTIVTNGGAANNYHLDWDLHRITWDFPQSYHHGDYDVSWFDIENDGLEDIALAQGHYVPATDKLFIFHQEQDHSFSDITKEVGLMKNETKDEHLLEVFDYDLDGDDDIVICNNAAPNSLRVIENKIGQDNHWTAINLVAPAGVNYNAIGARINVWAGGVKRMRDVYAGRGNDGGQQSFAMIFGLGNNTAIDSVTVNWPDAANTTTTVINPPINKYITISRNGLGVAQVTKSNTNSLKIYPNPAKDFVLIQLSDNTKATDVSVYDMMGRRMTDVGVFDNAGATKYCTVSHLATGQYIMKVTMKDGQVLAQSFEKIN